VQDRAILAAADSLTAPDDLRQQLKDYYGVDPDEALKAYYLDPDIALPLLQKQSAAARIGVQATRQGLQGVGKDLAEELQGIGVSEDQAKQGFATTAYQKGFGTSRGESADQNTRIDAILKGDAEAITTVERVKQGRVNRFEGGGAYVGSASGVSALGGSGT
jgi:putative NIF3 family GTP cyclohydrolase 1 type 2